MVLAIPVLGELPAVERGEGWTRGEPGEHGLDPEAVAAGVREIGGMAGVRTLLVVAGGELVVEEGFGGGDPAATHNLKSASKSLLSLVAGVALERGDLPGLDAPVGELLGRELEGGREAIRLRHLLTMTSGLESTSGEGYGAWVSAGDWTAAALARPLPSPPGEEFRYSTGNSHILAAALQRATGDDLLAYARRVLYEPLGIRPVTWQESPEGVRFGGNNLSMTPRDLARVGWMLLRGGTWNGRRVVPEGWIGESTEVHAEPSPDWVERYGEYGYLWWLPPGHDGAYVAVGYGGQFLYVAPRAGVAVVLTSTLEGKGTEWDQEVFAIFRDRFAGAADPGGAEAAGDQASPDQAPPEEEAPTGEASAAEASAAEASAGETALVLDDGAIARRELVAIGRDLEIRGRAMADVAALDGDARISGRVEGDVIVLGGSVMLAATARVSGDVFALGGAIAAAPGAEIGGRSVSHPTVSSAWLTLLEGPSFGLAATDPLVVGAKLALVTAWLALVLLFFATSSREVLATSESVAGEPFRNFFLGLTAVLTLVLAALFFSAFSAALVGIPMLVLVVVLLLVLKLWGMVAVFHAAGHWLFDLLGRRKPATALNVAVAGLAALGLFKLLPWIGPWVWTAATLIGVGATLDTKFGRREPWFAMDAEDRRLA